MNKLLANQKKAMSEPKPKTKSKVSPAAPAPMPMMHDKIGGLPSDRYYAASDAISSLSRAEVIKKDKKLQADMKKVAAHKIGELQAVMGGGRKR